MMHSTSQTSKFTEGKSLGTYKGSYVRRDMEASVISSDHKRYMRARRSLTQSTKKSLDLTLRRLEELMNSLVRSHESGDISKTKLTKNLKSALRRTYERAFKLGLKANGLWGTRPIQAPLDEDELRWVKSAYSQEMTYFNRFLKDIVGKTSRMPVEKRISSYVSTINSVYESARVVSAAPSSKIYWVLESDDPCPDCRLLHRESPFTKDTLPTTPRAGLTRCLHNCYCKLRFVQATAEELQILAERNIKRENFLRKIQRQRRKK